MSTSADGHTEKGVRIAASSMHDSDDGCDSENSFGSYFGDNAMDEFKELDSSPPAYSNEDSELDGMYVKSPSVDLIVIPLYTPPTRSTQPPFNARSSGPSMCVVCGLIFNPALILIN